VERRRRAAFARGERPQHRDPAAPAARRSAGSNGRWRARDIPVELVGLGGLLATPEVRDVVATLQVLSDATAGAALIRLLTGARWRLGPRDLDALGRRGPVVGPIPARRAAGVGRVGHRRGRQPDEALDDPGERAPYSAEGFRRLDALRRELDVLRRRTAAPLPELIADVERTLGVDVEVVAAGGTRAHLDRFLDVTAQFAEDAEVATLGAYLAYLAAAEAQERGLEAGEVEVTGERCRCSPCTRPRG